MQQIESHTTEKFSKESRTHRNGNRSTDDSHFSTGASLRTWRCHGRRFAWQRRLAMSLAARHRVASPRESWSCVRRKQGRTTLTGRKALPIDANGENCRGHVSFVVFFFGSVWTFANARSARWAVVSVFAVGAREWKMEQ